MQHGPAASNKKSASNEFSQYQHTPTSKFIGTAFGAVVEQLFFHPIDTIGKTAMANKQSSLPWLRALVVKEGIAGTTKQLYGGFVLGVSKKGPLRVYKYGVQDELNQKLSREYTNLAQQYFGAYGNVVIQATAGAITGAAEPWLFQPIDTLQVRKQVLKEKISIANASNLGVRNLYRGSLITGLGRNVPGSIGLFGGSELANQLMDNQDHKSDFKNLMAKWGGAFLSLVLSQPGDVIKTNMQVNQISFLTTIKGLTLKKLFTSGLGPRLVMSSKVGAGFLIIEKSINFSKAIFGKKIEESTPPSSGMLEDDTKIRDDVLSSSSKPFITSYNPGVMDKFSSKSRLVESEEEIKDLTEKINKVKI